MAELNFNISTSTANYMKKNPFFKQQLSNPFTNQPHTLLNLPKPSMETNILQIWKNGFTCVEFLEIHFSFITNPPYMAELNFNLSELQQ